MPRTNHLPARRPAPCPPLPAPGDRAGCGTALLVMVAGLGTVLTATTTGYGLIRHPGSELPGQGAWDAYLTVALLWALAAGTAALVTAFAPSARGGRSTARRIALLDAGMALAILWPLEAAALALRLATRPALRRGVRPAALAVGGLVLVGGGWWGATAYGNAQPREVGNVPPGTLVGEWRTSDGGLLWLDADGRFTATQVPRQIFTGDWDSASRIDETGSWAYDGYGFSFVLDPGVLGGTDGNLDVYRTGSARMLCVVEDPDTACEAGRTFRPVSGPAAAAR